MKYRRPSSQPWRGNCRGDRAEGVAGRRRALNQGILRSATGTIQIPKTVLFVEGILREREKLERIGLAAKLGLA